MNTVMRSSTTAIAVALGLVLAWPVRAQANDPGGYGDGYQSGTYGRIRFTEGGATIVRADGQTDERERSGVNAPIFPGDTLRTDGGQRVEVQLGNGTIVRMDRGGELIFQSLPNPYAKYQDNSVLALSAGTIEVIANLRDKEEFRIDTRSASVYLLGNGEFRIDADGRGGASVASMRGVAEVVGNDSSVLVRGGTRTAVIAGSAPDEPRAYSAFASDGFDRWCASRETAYRTPDAIASSEGVEPEDVPATVRPYYGELSASGMWTTVPEYGTVWSPVGVGAGWRPYSDGYWSYGPGGYFWVSYEPWGWAPYHYGNWQWVGGHGWCWIPGSLFAGAWVSWSWGSLYVGWAPLDYWGRPGWAGGPYSYGYYDPGCWNFVDYDHVGSTNVHRYAVPIDRVGDGLRDATVVARPPRVDPRKFRGNEGSRERALREVAGDGSAHLRPITKNSAPERKLSDVQDQLMRRASRATAAPSGSSAGSSDPARAGNAPSRSVGPKARDAADGAGGGQRGEAPVGRQRRILADPRNAGRPAGTPSSSLTLRPDARDGVRDLYQRMSRPRETREQAVAPSTDRSRRTPPADAQAAPTRGRAATEPQRSQANVGPRAPRSSPAASPRAVPPRQQTPARSAPQAAPRSQPRSAPPAGQAQPRHGDKH